MKKNLCFSTADILLPKKDFEKFSVIACDQFTSEPEYWDKVYEYTKGYPTSLDLILPEINLKDDNSAEIELINHNMNRYIESGVFNEVKDSFIFVRRRQSDGVLRLGLVGKIDLKEYSYSDDFKAQVRSTEKTVLERIPPRAKIRKDAIIELPHIMLLFDDPEDSVLGNLERDRENLRKLYDFDLFGGSGSIEGYTVNGDTAKRVIDSLGVIKDKNAGFVFCVGDGNHSLAAAKSIYDESGLEKDRYALVEIVNIHSPAINFEPIYRVVFGVNPEKFLEDFTAYCKKTGGKYEHSFKCVSASFCKRISIKSNYRLPVAALQNFLDNEKQGVDIDYIHGVRSTEKISVATGDRLGFMFEGIDKSELFDAVGDNGSLPRKTFSLGHALDKRFYLEARVIK